MLKKLADYNGKLSAIDLFSGAGGLTVGLKRAGFQVVAAVEIDRSSVNTYKANHPEVHVFHGDIRKVKGSDLLKRAGLKSVDIVAGCPPCQGFSKLTDKSHKEDSRNELVLEMARVIEEIKPKVVMLENVPGLAGRGYPLLRELENKLRSMGYIITKKVLQLADYGVPQSRRRLVLLAGLGFEVNLPRQTHARVPHDGLKSWVALRRVLKQERNPVTYSQAVQNGGPKMFNWHIVRNIKPITLERFKHLLPGASRYALPEELRPPCHKSAKGFQNVYGRMSWEEISPTITSGCLTLSSGRFGHPVENRTISIREAATIQTFPKSYRFEADTLGKACELVGNALPCRFAEVASLQCKLSIEKAPASANQ